MVMGSQPVRGPATQQGIRHHVSSTLKPLLEYIPLRQLRVEGWGCVHSWLMFCGSACQARMRSPCLSKKNGGPSAPVPQGSLWN